MEELHSYTFEVTLTYTGTVTARAATKEEAEQLVKNDWNRSLGNVHSASMTDNKEEKGIEDWNFYFQPVKTIK